VWNYVRTSVFFPYPRIVSDTTFSSNGFDPARPLFDFAFLAHVTTDRGLVNGVGVSSVGADIN
jgi:hypothetical protein